MLAFFVWFLKLVLLLTATAALLFWAFSFNRDGAHHWLVLLLKVFHYAF